MYIPYMAYVAYMVSRSAAAANEALNLQVSSTRAATATFPPFLSFVSILFGCLSFKSNTAATAAAVCA